MRVLLLSANTETINMPVLPVGLAGVAAAAPRAGHETRVLNLMGTEAPDDNLFFPRFYIRPELEGWLQETAGRWAEKRPGWFFQSP